MLRDIILLALGAVFGLGTALAAMAAPLYFPNAPSWVWHWMFWLGIALMALMLADGVILLFFSRIAHLGPAALANVCLLGLAIAGIWQGLPSAEMPKKLPILAVECAVSKLPIVMPSEGLAFVDLFDPGWDGAYPVGFAGYSFQPGERLQWYEDRTLGQTMRCVMTNQEKFTLFAINFSLKVRFRENILSDDGRSSRSGEITKERDWPLAISKIDPGKSFTFYALTQGTNYANASFPQTASYFDPATNEQKEVRLLLLGWDSLGVTPATINSQKSQH